MGTLTSPPLPDVLIRKSQVRSEAIYADVNPVPSKGTPILVYDATAVFASLRNLFLCPIGGRARIFQEDYGSGLYDLLQEPFDDITANKISSVLFQSIRKWEPRVRIDPSDLLVIRDSSLPGYAIQVTVTVRGQRSFNTFKVQLSGTSFG